jgi:hypothetical protein
MTIKHYSWIRKRWFVSNQWGGCERAWHGCRRETTDDRRRWGKICLVSSHITEVTQRLRAIHSLPSSPPLFLVSTSLLSVVLVWWWFHRMNCFVSLATSSDILLYWDPIILIWLWLKKSSKFVFVSS